MPRLSKCYLVHRIRHTAYSNSIVLNRVFACCFATASLFSFVRLLKGIGSICALSFCKTLLHFTCASITAFVRQPV